MNSSKKKALWSGRFSTGAHEEVLSFSQSVGFDKRLYAYDIFGSVAHAKMLCKAGLITSQERNAIVKGLQKIYRLIQEGKFRWSTAREDVHMNIESALTSATPAGAKLHTGRSRNDQVALDIRLWLKEQILKDIAAIRQLQSSLVQLAKKNKSVVIPGYTHLQRAQPVYLAHHLLAYVEMFERDAGRLRDAFIRADVCPLGSGAIAGSSLPLRREYVAKMLGFSDVTQNSMDAVSDRDFLIEYASAASLVAVHLSRMGEDLILWSSSEFGFIRIGDAFTTGSSLMPQKKNPDVAELARGKSARVIGNLVSLLTLLKGLPMTYNRDLQEDKERVFDTADTIQSSLRVVALMLRDIQVMKSRCEEAASDPLLLATDIVDALVRLKIPFRKAHEIVGRAVALSEKQNIPLNQLSLKNWRSLHPSITPNILKSFDLRTALERRNMTGAPSCRQINQQISRWEKLLGR